MLPPFKIIFCSYLFPIYVWFFLRVTKGKDVCKSVVPICILSIYLYTYNMYIYIYVYTYMYAYAYMWICSVYTDKCTFNCLKPRFLWCKPRKGTKTFDPPPVHSGFVLVLWNLAPPQVKKMQTGKSYELVRLWAKDCHIIIYYSS